MAALSPDLQKNMIKQFVSIKKTKKGVFTKEQMTLLKRAFGDVMRGFQWVHMNMGEDLSRQQALLAVLETKGVVDHLEVDKKFDEIEHMALKNQEKKYPGESEGQRESQTLWIVREMWRDLDGVLSHNHGQPEASEYFEPVSKGRRQRKGKP